MFGSFDPNTASCLGRSTQTRPHVWDSKQNQYLMLGTLHPKQCIIFGSFESWNPSCYRQYKMQIHPKITTCHITNTNDAEIYKYTIHLNICVYTFRRCLGRSTETNIVHFFSYRWHQRKDPAKGGSGLRQTRCGRSTKLRRMTPILLRTGLSSVGQSKWSKPPCIK